MSRTERQDTRIHSVMKALDVLENLAEDGGIASISSLSARTGISASTIFRILSTLVSRGYVMKTARGEYSMGAAFFSLVHGAGTSLGATLNEELSSLSEVTGESVSIAMLDSSEALYIAHKSSTRSMRQFTRIGNRVALYCTGVGKALLSALSQEERAKILGAAKLKSLTPNTITKRAELETEIETIQRLGYAIDNEEQELGVRCMAIQIPNFPSFALSVSGPPSRMTHRYMLSTVKPEIDSSARKISEIMSA